MRQLLNKCFGAVPPPPPLPSPPNHVLQGCRRCSRSWEATERTPPAHLPCHPGAFSQWVHPGASASHHTTYFWTSPRWCSMHRAEFKPPCLPFTRKKQAPCPAEGPTRAAQPGFLMPAGSSKGSAASPGKNPQRCPAVGDFRVWPHISFATR